MARLMEISEVCDVCLRDDQRREPAALAETVTIGKVTRELMLCEKHIGPLLELRGLLEQYGIKPDAPMQTTAAKNSKPRQPTLMEHGLAGVDYSTFPKGEAPPCPECGWTSTSKTPRSRLGEHMKTRHGLNVREVFPGLLYKAPEAADLRPPREWVAGHHGGALRARPVGV